MSWLFTVLSEYDNINGVIVSFGNQLTEDLIHERGTGVTRRFPADLHRIACRKLQYLNSAGRLSDTASPPGNRLEKLGGHLRGFYSVRINDRWRIVFRWHEGRGPSDVRIADYH